MRYNYLTARETSFGGLTKGKKYRVLSQDIEYYNTYLVEQDCGQKCCYSHSFFEETKDDNPKVIVEGNTIYIDY